MRDNGNIRIKEPQKKAHFDHIYRNCPTTVMVIGKVMPIAKNQGDWVPSG